MKPLKLLYLLTMGAVAFFAALLIFATFPIPGNYKVMAVLSGSMEPQVKLGGLVLVKPFESYQVGDVITYRNPANAKQTVTHRIVEVKKESQGTSFITKGDANSAPDAEPVQLRNVVGKVLFSMPFLGYGVVFVKQPIGFFLLILLPATFIIYDEIRKIKDEVVKIRNKKTLIMLIFSTVLITTGFTNAYYSDTEASIGNIFQATSWDVWVQTNQADFEAGTQENVDTTTSSGDVLLSGAYPVTGDTVALWHFNEGEGDTVDDATGVNNGTLHNFTDGWVNGKFNKGLEFDGVDDYVEVADSESLDITGQITVEAWVKANTEPSGDNIEHIVSKQRAYVLGWDHTSPLANAAFWIYDGSNWYSSGMAANPSPGVWHHLAGVYDGNAISLYIDGVLVASNTIGAKTIAQNANSVIIGAAEPTKSYYGGIIDEVRISNTAKTSFPVDYFANGTLESQVFDAGEARDWDKLEWDEELPDGTDITIEIATSDNGSSWSTWFGPYASSPVDLNGAGVSNSRFIKWKATLTTSSSDKTPKLKEVRVRHFKIP